MLADDVINEFLQLLKLTYPAVEGLQDPLLGQKRHFNVMKNKPFVQVLHTASLHWIAISTIGCTEGEVKLLDSLYSSVNEHTRRQICDLLMSDSHEIKIKVLSVQQQTNSVDCGPFALAFITSEILGENVSEISFDEINLRNHMRACFEKGKVTAFPKCEKNVKRCKENNIGLTVFCSCRQFWTKKDLKEKGKAMAECTNCFKWFHEKCENIPRRVFTKKNINWFCSKCK